MDWAPKFHNWSCRGSICSQHGTANEMILDGMGRMRSTNNDADTILSMVKNEAEKTVHLYTINRIGVLLPPS
ncbi:hypothetical protein FLAG1_03300 [Fusarium langsethiae]|uniref:Uncharacterized protein n=1 Tax=Fusarium langsethiae TaxID=179993 RepID=A0A0N0DGB0_FUSLA|nr:hypothetical protein FLAG1_03300 [Fusarium langsethiae]